jgi:hypothetical protein
MRLKLPEIVEIVWRAAFMICGAILGALYGWTQHGLIGAIALAFVGMIFGLFASSPSILRDFI